MPGTIELSHSPFGLVQVSGFRISLGKLVSVDKKQNCQNSSTDLKNVSSSTLLRKEAPV